MITREHLRIMYRTSIPLYFLCVCKRSLQKRLFSRIVLVHDYIVGRYRESGNVSYFRTCSRSSGAACRSSGATCRWRDDIGDVMLVRLASPASRSRWFPGSVVSLALVPRLGGLARAGSPAHWRLARAGYPARCRALFQRRTTSHFGKTSCVSSCAPRLLDSNSVRSYASVRSYTAVCLMAFGGDFLLSFVR